MGKGNWQTITSKKFGHDISVQASECPSVRTDSGGGEGGSRGNPNEGAEELHFCVAGNRSYVRHTALLGSPRFSGGK